MMGVTDRATGLSGGKPNPLGGFAMSSVITFSNHSPIRVADADLIETVWSSGQDFGHHLLKRYVTKQGKAIYWASYNSGRCYNGRSPDTSRTYLPNVSEIKEYFTRCELDHTYHAEVEAKVDEASIIDVDAIR